MDRMEALNLVKEQITEKRYIHTLGVMQTAIELAEKYGADVKRSELAAIFHDYAKFRSKEEMEQIIIKQNMPKQLLDYHSELWHAPVGAYLVQMEAGITDEEILQAIRFHTTGNKDMNLLDKIVFLADYIEPGRKFPGVDEVRKAANESLDQAVIMALKNTIKFLLDKNQAVYPDTLETYNSMVRGKKIRKEDYNFMSEKDIVYIAAKAADDKRAEDITVLDMRGVSLVADYFIICHGNSEKQVQAIAREVKDKAQESDIHIKRLEGFDEARWVLVDLGDVIVHVFHRDERIYYNLERLWGDAARVNIQERLV